MLFFSFGANQNKSSLLFAQSHDQGFSHKCPCPLSGRRNMRNIAQMSQPEICVCVCEYGSVLFQDVPFVGGRELKQKLGPHFGDDQVFPSLGTNMCVCVCVLGFCVWVPFDHAPMLPKPPGRTRTSDPVDFRPGARQLLPARGVRPSRRSVWSRTWLEGLGRGGETPKSKAREKLTSLLETLLWFWRCIKLGPKWPKLL